MTTMESVLAFLALSSLLLFNSSVDARKEPAEYWKDAMKDQPMPEAIRGLLCSNSGSLHTPLETQKQEKFNFDFNLQSTAIIYHGREEKKSFVKNFEPRPNISVYNDGVKQN